MNLSYRKATIADIDLLITLRLKVLRHANNLSDDADMRTVAEESKRYYERSLQGGTHIAFVVYDGGDVIGAGGVSFYQVLPTYHNPSGKKAYIMNMFTEPSYRRRGIGRNTLNLLVQASREAGVDFIALEATKMGRPLYEQYGFEAMLDEMILPE